MRIGVVMSLLLFGCGASPQSDKGPAMPIKEPPPPRWAPGVSLDAVGAECADQALTTVYARVGLGNGQESWSDLAVRGPKASAVEVCQDIASKLFPPQIKDARILRECSSEVPAAVNSPNPGMLLVQPVPGLPITFDASGKPLACAQSAVVHYTRSPTRRDCSRVKDQLLERDRQSRLEGEKKATEWLTAELEVARERKVAACLNEVNQAKKCTPVDTVAAAFEKACKRKKSKRCAQAKEAVVEAQGCEINVALYRRECGAAISRIKVIEARLAAPPEPEPAAAITCF